MFVACKLKLFIVSSKLQGLFHKLCIRLLDYGFQFSFDDAYIYLSYD